MDQYKSHKVVKAAEMVKIEHAGIRKMAIITLIDGKVIEIAASFLARGTPKEGDFLVKYSDDYYSWSPRKVFLSGYDSIVEFNLEKEIEKRGLTAPRITEEDILNAIIGEDYHRFADSTVTVCCLTLRNGFNVIGKSACASKENFDEELGNAIAKQNAINEIGQLEGYLLKQKLYEELCDGSDSITETIDKIAEEGVITHSNGDDTGIHENNTDTGD